MRYKLIDDKPKILIDMKQRLGNRLTTVFVRQGHYAAAAIDTPGNPEPDISVACIGELRERKLADFQPAAPGISAPVY